MTEHRESLEEVAGLIQFRIGAWHDFGYENPPSPDCKTIPPLGERSAEAIGAGHNAVENIDELIGRLHQLRAKLVSELRQDADIRAARIDAMLAERRAAAASCGHPANEDGECSCASWPERAPII